MARYLMIDINLGLWMAMLGVAIGESSAPMVRWVAVAGIVFAIGWEHSIRRGFFHRKRPIVSGQPSDPT